MVDLELNEVNPETSRIMEANKIAAERQHEAGKLTAQERVSLLLDEGSFVEIDALVTHRCSDFGMAKKVIPGDGVITGFGTIDSRLIYLFAHDFTVLGGSVSETNAKKICKIMDLAIENGAPIIGLNDGGGARIQEGIDSLGGYAEIVWRNTMGSGVVPQISAIMGPCAGGSAYSPALTDFIFMVKKTSHMFVTGPDIIKAVNREEVTKDELGGSGVHTTKTGTAHFEAATDFDCLRGIRELLSYLPSNNLDDPPTGTSQDPPDREEPWLDDFVPADTKIAFDVKKVIVALVDDGQFLEVHKNYARNLITGFARFGNRSVGILANQSSHLAGVLDIDASLKGTRFVRFCDAFGLPIVTFVDTPGYLPGLDQEMGGIIKHGAKFLYAFSEATVPTVTIVLRKAYGGSYAVMGSKHLHTDISLAYPTAEIAVMGAEAAVSFLYRRELKIAGPNLDEVKAQKIVEYRRHFSSPHRAAERGFIDGIIKPRETRPWIVRSLWQLRNKRSSLPPKKHGNMPI